VVRIILGREKATSVEEEEVMSTKMVSYTLETFAGVDRERDLAELEALGRRAPIARIDF